MSSIRARFLPPALIALFALLMLTITWRRWPDILVDFGAQLYTAWQLASGKKLYVDVAHVYGPLSPFLYAGAFRVFGENRSSTSKRRERRREPGTFKQPPVTGREEIK